MLTFLNFFSQFSKVIIIITSPLLGFEERCQMTQGDDRCFLYNKTWTLWEGLTRDNYNASQHEDLEPHIMTGAWTSAAIFRRAQSLGRLAWA